MEITIKLEPRETEMIIDRLLGEQECPIQATRTVTTGMVSDINDLPPEIREILGKVVNGGTGKPQKGGK